MLMSSAARNTEGSPEPPVTPRWVRSFARRLLVTDALIVIGVVLVITRLQFHTLNPFAPYTEGELHIQYGVISLGVITIWLLALVFDGSRDSKVLGSGPREYQRVLWSSASAFLLVLMFAFFTQTDLARTYVAGVFALGTLCLLISRWLWRSWLSRQRATGKFSSRVILAGSLESVRIVAEELARHPEAGYWVVGACLSPSDKPLVNSSSLQLSKREIPVLGTQYDALASMQLVGADTLVITSADDLPPQRVRELSWGLEPGRQHLVVAPSLLDVGGPRIHTRPVAGVPLMHVETPRFEGAKRYIKRAFDVVASAVFIILLSPLLIYAALAVKFGSTGPILFRQERAGLGGKPFMMLKFRSMVTNAEELLKKLQDADRAEGNTVMFKMKDDPRVTPIGKFLRRFSIDELPQLFNVLLGSMSLVGPRPPLQREVDTYEQHVHRRFMVKPGITGLWQVSGRSNLSWDETVRLDLYYVENWSLTGDVVILWKTARAVLRSDGAY
jgi:exopolysaccharide biosynthesis polyprenyl glycosylphosphotransferase